MTRSFLGGKRLAIVLGAGSLIGLLGLLGASVAAAAGPEDRAATETVLREVEASPKKDVVAEMIARSKAALDRAARLRAAGDEPHARLADGLAKTWADAARDVLRAVDVEARAEAARRAATDAGVVAERERALLEEGIAQSGRVRAQLESAERESKEQPARTSKVANSDLADGGAAPRAPKAPAAPTVPRSTPAARDGGAR
jgi:hypothetical protein